GDAQKKSEGSPTITGFPHGAGRESTSPRMLPETWRGPHPPSARGSFHFARIWRSSSAVRWKLLAPEGIAFGLEPRLSAESACDHIRLQPACHDARRDGSPNEPGITGGSRIRNPSATLLLVISALSIPQIAASQQRIRHLRRRARLRRDPQC